MKLITYRETLEDEARVGVVCEEMVLDVGMLGEITGEALPDTMLDLIDSGPATLAVLRRVIEEFDGEWPAGVALPLASVRLEAPIPRPRKNIFGIGLNYVEHVAESARGLDTSKDLPKEPVIFSKPPTAVIGPDQPILHNAAMTQQLDWEVELAVVMGRRATRVGVDDALSCVFGYTVMIDISARDCRRAGQWIYSKGQDTFAPMGPCIVTADEIPDPQALNLWLKVNGVEKQNSNTRHMLFDVKTLIADISAGITLEPGDVIATGTPEGVGAGRDPQEWLWPGDHITAHVEGIGTICHPIAPVGDARSGL